MVKGRKGHYRELFEDIRKKGFNKVRIDGEIKDIIPKMQVDRYKIHDIEIVIDRLEVTADIRSRLYQSLQVAMKHGKGTIMVTEHEEETTKTKKKTQAYGFGKLKEPVCQGAFAMVYMGYDTEIANMLHILL